MTERDEKQLEVIQNYMRAGPDRCTLELSTGFGKSYIAITILKQLMPDKVLLLVNSTVLRDDSWKTEFEKFGMKDYYEENVETATYQLAYKWKEGDKNLDGYFIIADEADFASDVPELSKFFYEYPENKILALTGFITASKREWFTNNLPVFVTLTAADAQESGILNKIHVVFVKYDLSKDPNDITVEYTKNGVKKSFKQSENEAYNYRHNLMITAIIAKEYTTKAFLRGEVTYDKYKKELESADWRIKAAARDRAELLIHSKSSAEMARKLLKFIETKHPDSKTVVFSKRQVQSEKVVGDKRAYHGKLSKKESDLRFNSFKDGDLRVLGVCDKLNRGVNIDHLDTAIFETFYGSDTQGMQRLGRMMRLAPEDTATVYILLPYFMRTVKIDGQQTYALSATQQVVWAKKMLRSTEIKSSAVWDYRAVKDETI